MKPTLADESEHEPGPELYWQESAVLNWRDSTAGVGGNLHLGRYVNRGIANVLVGVYTDDGLGYRINSDDHPVEHVDRGLISGPLRIVHDGEHLRALVDTPDCALDLIITDLSDDAEAPASHDSDFGDRVASVHFNVECALRGTVRIGDRRIEVKDGYGHRDHSSGERKFKPGESVGAYRWLAGGVPGRITFSLYWMLLPGGGLIRRGWARIAGERIPVVDQQITLELMEDGISARGARARFTLDNGEPFDVRYEAKGGAAMVVEELTNIMQAGNIEFSDGSRGYATLEYVNNVSQGADVPSFSEFVLVANGINATCKPVA